MIDEGVFKEGAKATREVAKTGGKLVDAGREVGAFFNKIFGETLVNLVDLKWTDRIKARRIEAAIYDWVRLEKLFQRAKQELENSGVKKTKALPPKIALPLIEHATVEHEKVVQEMWAKLLATALTPAAQVVTRTYITVLEELTAEDARALQKMYHDWQDYKDREPMRSGPIEFDWGIDAPSRPPGLAVKFFRLGLVAPTTIKISVHQPPERSRYGDHSGTSEDVVVPGDLESLKFTSFGESFCKAVGIGVKRKRKKPRNRGS